MAGREWIIEAYGCDEVVLADPARLSALFDLIIRSLDLHPVCEPVWHQFPNTGGLTGLYLLAESHVACHTFPEHRSICLNVFCCRPRPDWDFAGCLQRELAARSVTVRSIDRPYSDEPNRQLSELRSANPVSLV